ncbi:MAG: homoserine kinase [Myxococcales bacterium]|nr:homoserine kinase [Myxococcales bacterium]
MKATVYAPATLSNLGPGFDVLGMALDIPLDSVTASLGGTGIRVIPAGPYGSRVPVEPERNVAAFTAQRVLKALNRTDGLELRVEKQIPPGSGLGSSAASAVAGAVATLRACGGDISAQELLAICGQAEALTSGTAHLDNVAPALLGGLVGVVGTDPPQIERLELPTDWRFAVILPHVEVRTEDARRVLPDTVPLSDAVQNLRHLTALLAAVGRQDLQTFATNLEDHLAIPYRAPLLPFYEACALAAQKAGAIKLQVSGSGPALFAPCANPEQAQAVCTAVEEALVAWHIDATTYVCKASSSGALGRSEVSAQ